MPYSNINRVVLVGRLTRDPELRALPSGTNVCSLRIACNGRRKGDDGQYEEKPAFLGVSVFGAHGEVVHRHMARGRQVAIDGRLDWREWEGSDGDRREAVEIVADSVEFLGDRAGAEDDLVGVGAGAEEDIGF